MASQERSARDLGSAAAAAPQAASKVIETSGNAQAPCNGSAGASLLRFDEQRVGRRAVVTAVGEVDINSAADLYRALEAAGDGAAPEIWLDLTGTTFMDCSGLHALLDVRASLREANRGLVLICPAGPVLRLLVLTGLDREFEIHPTRAAAQCAN